MSTRPPLKPLDDALAEHDFIAFEEPYRRMPGA